MMESLFGNAECPSLFKEVGLIRPSMLSIKDNATWVFASFPSSANVYVTISCSCVPAAEQRQVLAADERRREFHEEKRKKFESHAEEENDGGPAPTDFSRGRPDHQLTKTLLFQSKTRGPERAPNSGGSSTTMGCTPPTSTTGTTPEQVEASVTLLQFSLR